MNWIAQTEKDAVTQTLAASLWDSIGLFRANPGLKFHAKFQIADCMFKGAESSAFGIRHSSLASFSIHGVEKTDETGRLSRMNLAVHGLEGDIRHGGQANTYRMDFHDATGRFDFVLANPPFNGNAVHTKMRVSASRHPKITPQELPERQDHERLKDMAGPGRRFPLGRPCTDSATATRVSAKLKLAKPGRRSVGETELHYLWTQLVCSALKNGEAGTSGARGLFVMANSASEAGASEQEILQELIAVCLQRRAKPRIDD